MGADHFGVEVAFTADNSKTVGLRDAPRLLGQFALTIMRERPPSPAPAWQRPLQRQFVDLRGVFQGELLEGAEGDALVLGEGRQHLRDVSFA